jgi:hypothetical protein
VSVNDSAGRKLTISNDISKRDTKKSRLLLKIPTPTTGGLFPRLSFILEFGPVFEGEPSLAGLWFLGLLFAFGRQSKESNE